MSLLGGCLNRKSRKKRGMVLALLLIFCSVFLCGEKEAGYASQNAGMTDISGAFGTLRRENTD